MGRKTVGDVRKREILDAYEHCISIKGIHATTLQDIATHAVIQRPAIRHFVGNRDEMRIALAQRILDEAQGNVVEFSNVMNDQNGKTELAIMAMLVKAITVKPQRIITISHLLQLSEQQPQIEKILQGWFNCYSRWLSSVLKLSYDEPASKLDDIASGIISMCVGYGSLTPVTTAKMTKQITQSISYTLLSLKPIKKQRSKSRK